MAASRIDIHHHFFLPEYIAAMGPLANMPQVRNWTLERTHEEMDKNGVGAAVLSLSPPGIHLGASPDSRRLARIVNDHAAKLRGAQPARFGHFASVPMPDVEGTLAEIAYALDTLKADGIALISSYDGRWLGDAAFRPVFSELNRRNAVVFVHPAGLPEDTTPPGIKSHILEAPFDTTRTIFSLLHNGILSSCPDIRFIFAHGGGAVPYLAGRVAALSSGSGDMTPDRIHDLLNRLYFDTAIVINEPALAALTKFCPRSQILLGIDSPIFSPEAEIKAWGSIGLDPDLRPLIERSNAAALLGRGQ